ncbi:major facilitator superfamily domain-containing protein [Aspergillus ambiguus]|uniref:major facilitator superfamily domain-containing protein n=1 Tax=Aspergillus ambiguus TaxID=176160 RepID=UPI003CCCB585
MDCEKGPDTGEKIIESQKQNERSDKRALIRDSHGLPLVPQPSSHKDDPLNWHPAMKLLVTLQASWLALLGPMGSATPNPAFVLMADAFKMPVVEISYELTVFLVFAGLGPLIASPFGNGYGRRPVYLLGNLIAAVTNIGAGYCNTWSGVLVTRVFNGLGAGATIAMGAATICDLYFVHQRGVYMGIYTLFLTNGAHLAPILGGFVAEYLGWRACFFIPGYVQIGTFIMTLFCLPETLYSLDDDPEPTSYRQQTYLENLIFKNSRVPGRRPRLGDFTRPFSMLKCIVILLPATFYMTCFGYGSVLFALTGAKLFTHLYGFTTPQTGLMLSVPLLIGCFIGELSAGWVTDLMSNRYAQKHNGERLPEARLNALWGALLIPIGIIIEGVCLTHSDSVSWVGSAFGMGIANLGLQIATTVIYAYTTDCYRPQSAEISTILNIFRQIFSCLISFYALPFAAKAQIQYAWLTFALINVTFLVPVLILRIYGPRWRNLPSQKI